MNTESANTALSTIWAKACHSSQRLLTSYELKEFEEVASQLTQAVRGDDYAEKRAFHINERLKISYFGSTSRQNCAEWLMEECQSLERYIERLPPQNGVGNES